MVYSLFFLVLAFVLVQSTCFAKEVMLSYQQYGRLNQPANAEASDNWVGLSYDRLKEHSGGGLSKIAVDARYYNGNGRWAVSVPELYYRKDRTNSHMAFGRQILDWAPNEKFWLLGELNPQRGFNLLEENQEGVMGAKFSRSKGPFQVDVFGSYLYAPQLNPGYAIQDGRVVGQTEWSKLPPTKVSYNDAEVPLRYTLENPDMGKLIFRPTLGMRLGLNWGSGGVSVYGIHKPESQVRINATGHYEQDTVEQAAVTAKPFANQQNIVGTHVMQKLGQVELTVGGMAISPEKKGDPDFQFEAIKIQPVYEDYVYSYAGAAYKSAYGEISANYIELMNNLNGKEVMLGKTTRWRKAVGGKVDYNFSDRFVFAVSYRQDLEIGDRLLTQSVGYNVSKSAKVMAGIEFLEAPQKTSFWASYRTNDSVYTRLLYNF